ncbi:C-5 cytosine methyltransferase [Kalmanozyma brasiliensis GHG001]|nr:C-5 cytosine methyltransferase [Kalmanozyma brasiliensis GHG001]KAF6767187.1 C-5 cytosine methyltransferase [Kalmanozyma brasiliensis GHG001]
MAGPKTAQRELIKTTHTVAKVLSSDFGLRSGYEVVDANTRTRPTAASLSSCELIGDNGAATALKAFLAQQDNKPVSPTMRRVAISPESLATIKSGDVVVIELDPSNQLMLVHAVKGQTVSGTRLSLSIDNMLHDVLAANEVFATNETVTTELPSIIAKIDPNSVALRYAWDDKRPAFIGLKEWTTQEAVAAHEIVYHEGDFVLLEPRDNGPLLDVAQVHRIRNQQVLVRYLHRQALPKFKDERLLVPSKELARIDTATFKPVATCRVSLPPSSTSWTTEGFYVSKENAHLLRAECETCTPAQMQRRKIRRNLEVLRSMELMCGAGGLSVGLGLSGACETTFAIDADTDSVKTFKGHHPGATTYCCDAGDALHRAVSGRRAKDGLELPRRGDVDLIAAGPPCQGFSRKNKMATRKAAEDDPRNLLVCTVLGWVEFLKPKYLILENVEGFTASKLGGREQGMVKLVIKCLLDLGYAATCGFVQSGAFGCPQSRGRFVLLAARADVTLPSLPKPTYHFLGKAATSFTWTDGHGTSHAAERPDTAALLPTVTVLDAIDDLPAFDWKDPHLIYAGPDQIEQARQQQDIPQLEVSSGSATGFVAAQYRKRPSNSFQERMRVFAGQMTRAVSQHQTSGPSATDVEQVVNVALRPGADYDSWSQPEVNKPALLGPLQLNRWQDSYFKYERIDGDRYFKVLLTDASAKGSMIHPTQRRLFTVRECARAQGFPDWIEFATDANLKSAYRQIGNAVPVPLAVALGESITAARLKDAERASRQPSQSPITIDDE